MFIIVPESLFHEAIAIGPFNHKEDAEAYARSQEKGRIWRVIKLEAPKAKEPA